MKKQTKKNNHLSLINQESKWHKWLKHLLKPQEYEALIVFNAIGMEGACAELNISRFRCSCYLKSCLKKISYYFKLYREIERKAKIHTLTRRQFISAPLEDIGLSTRTYHLLKSADLFYIFQVLRLGEKRLYRIKGFGEKAMIELKSILRYKGCLDLLE